MSSQLLFLPHREHSNASHIPKCIPSQEEIRKSQSLFSWRAVLPIDTLDQWKTESGGDSVLLRVLERLSSPIISSHIFCSDQPGCFKSESAVTSLKQRRQKEWMFSRVCPSSIEAHGQQGRYTLDICVHWGLYIHFKPLSFILHNFSLRGEMDVRGENLMCGC